MPQKTLINSKKLKKSSQQWLSRQINDEFVKKSKIEGLRSRAAYKIIEIDDKFKIFKKKKIVVDLGAAPGGWSEYAVKKVGDNYVIAIDLLEMAEIDGVKFLHADFQEQESQQLISNCLKEIPYNKSGKCDIVMSDMAPNTMGERRTDHLRIMTLIEESLEYSYNILKNNGCFIAKIFQGGSSDEIVKTLRKKFKIVKYFKPKSSRKDSSETYLVAIGYKELAIATYNKINQTNKMLSSTTKNR